MVRISSSCWLKASVEHELDGPCRLGAVVTNNGYSDWSTQDSPRDRPDIWLRVRREFNDYFVETSREGRLWSQLRLARLLEDPGGVPVSCGLYACSPKAPGFLVQFTFLDIALGRI